MQWRSNTPGGARRGYSLVAVVLGILMGGSCLQSAFRQLPGSSCGALSPTQCSMRATGMTERALAVQEDRRQTEGWANPRGDRGLRKQKHTDYGQALWNVLNSHYSPPPSSVGDDRPREV